MKKVVFITGASRGIGLATAKKFSGNGWSVAGFYRTKPGPEIENCKYYQMDMSDSKSISESFDRAFKDFGQIDCLVNNAGMFSYVKGLNNYDIETINKVVMVNEVGVYLCTKNVLDKMAEGTIINISSTVSHVGSSDPIYAGTKAALLGFTKSMARQLAPKIRVNAVAPGATNTDMMKNYNPERVAQLVEATLLKRMGEPEDIANAVYFLATDESAHITGICLDVCAGYVMR
ncbi:SDR family oxidoreductase [Candidatus Shapirobacteria bacterium]|nr:SDR family oxidoreductase [Candidatus Shapirobacteria bacterium]